MPVWLPFSIVTLGKRIAARREALGWSQNELARRADLNHPTLNKIENGLRKDPSASIVVKIAHALGTTAEELLTGERSDGVSFLMQTDDASAVVEVRPVKKSKRADKGARERARAFVASALERAGAKLSDAGVAAAATDLATGGLASIDALRSVQRRLDDLEAWRRTQEAPARKRGSR